MKLLTEFRSLIERIKMSSLAFSTLKKWADRYSKMASAISFTTRADSEPIYNNKGVLLSQAYHSKVAIIEVDITKLLAGAGITFDKKVVKIKITGIEDDVTDIEDPDWELK